MERVDIKVGFQCNNHCIFCIQGNKREYCKDRTEDEIKKILEQGRSEGKEAVVFTGGEPTFRPKLLLNCVSYARDIGYRVIQIQSNGRMFAYRAYCEEIVRAGANEFSPAVHGSVASIHDRLTNAPGSFDQVTAGIRNLRELRQYILTNSVVTKINMEDIPNLAKLLVELRVDQFQFAFIHINPIIAEDQKLIEEVVPSMAKAMPYVKAGLDIGRKSGVKCMTEAIPYCMMREYEDLIAERIIPEAHVFDAEEDIEKYSEYRQNEGKSKGPRCVSECIKNDVCEGPWREYPQLFGWEEFKPITEEKI
ncbi:MAG: radical SAM protein [Candidatus Colwellbacteria bacterium]|nr:radical SAM protein [Candidatus Colwellbacteria bacterium]